MTAVSLVHCLEAAGNPQKAQANYHYFQAEEGGYGEGDRFCGVSNPECRKLVRRYRELPLDEIKKLLYGIWHEARLCGVLILVEQYKRGNNEERGAIVELYRQAAVDCRINNWDLVDLSAPGVIGMHEKLYHTGIIGHFSNSRNMWMNRIAVVSTMTLIKQGDFSQAFQLILDFRSHPHDLMHKACGWMLREIGKQDRRALSAFLNMHKLSLPRTTLRYAIEHYSDDERRAWLAR